MAAAQILKAGPTSVSVTATGSDAAPVWSDGATIAAGSFDASTDYIIIAYVYGQIGATNNRFAARLVQGATPTVLEDADGRAETTSSGADTRHPFFFMRRFTQPGTPVAVKLQIGTTSTADVEGDTVLMAIRASDLGTEGVDWFWQEVTTDYTTTTTPGGGASVTFTPNGTDTYAAICDAAIRVNSNTVTQTAKMELHDNVAGILQNIAQEGEEITGLERYQWMLGTSFVPTAVSHTVSARFWHATTAHTIYSSRVLVFRLDRFAQFARSYNAAVQTPATAPTWTNIAALSPTPAVTGDWMILGFFTDDPNSISTANDGLRTRLQINASGGGLVSNPGSPYGDDAPEQYGNDTTDLVPMMIGTVASLTSGASRAINLDVSQQTTVIRVLQTSLIAFSAELASAGGVVDGAIAISGTAQIAQAGGKLTAGAIAISGAAQVGLGGGRIAAGALALSGTGQVGLLGGKLQSGAIAIDGAGSVVLTGSRAMGGSIALAGSGQLGLTGRALFGGTLAVNGSGALGLAGGKLTAGSIAIAGAGSVALGGGKLHSAAIALNGSGSLGLTPTATFGGALAINGTGSLSLAAAGGGPVDGAIAIIGTGGLQATGSAIRGAGITLAGSGALGLSGGLLRAGALALNGAGQLGLAGGALKGATIAINGAAALSLTGNARFGGSIAIGGSGALGLDGSTLGSGASIGISASGSLGLNGSVVRSGALALQGSGSLALGGSRKTGSTIAIGGSGSVSLGGGLKAGGRISIDGAGDIDITSTDAYVPLDPAADASVTLGGLSGTVRLVETAVRLVETTARVRLT